MVEWSRVRSQRHGEPQPQEDIEEDSYRPVLWRKEWTSEQMRKVMQRESMSGMGVALDISANRQITKAITRRFFQVPFQDDECEGDQDEEGINDMRRSTTMGGG